MLDVQAMIAYNACTMKEGKQYTVRGISERLDNCLRETAAKYGSSLNTVAVEALKKGVGLGDEPAEHHDLDDLAGTWVKDPEFDKAMSEMDQIDEAMWQ
jgi:hypothetical protein